MKAILIAVALSVLNFSRAEDDGQYHPEAYGDDGSYRASNLYFDSRYRDYQYYLNHKYKNVFANSLDQLLAYHPVYFKGFPYQQSFTPFVSFDNRIDQEAYAAASAISSVTSSPASAVSAKSSVSSSTRPAVQVTSKVQPSVKVYSPLTARPLAYSSSKSQYAPVYSYHSAEPLAKIIRQDNDLDGNNYHYLYQTDNGIAAEESGNLGPSGGTRAHGFYEYIGDDGLKYRVDYTADENGFRPRGAHLPKSRK